VAKVRDLPEQVEALVDLFARYILETLGAEALDSEGTHHPAIEHGAAKHGRRELRLRGDVAVEPTRKRVAGASRIYDLCKRQCRRAKRRWIIYPGERPLTEECRRSVLSMLHHQGFRPHGEHFGRGAYGIALSREHPRLAVVDQQHVELSEHLCKVG